MKKIFIVIFILTGYFFLFPGIFGPSVLAVKYSLVAPTGDLVRGQTVRFTINVDTQQATIKTGEIGMTYETQYLEFVSTTPGNAMTTVSTSQLGGGKLLFSGENTAGFTGIGVFAYVDLKIIAQVPGETTLCVLWAPETSPTPIPTSTPVPGAPTSTPVPGAPTSPPLATNLPTSGETKKTIAATFLGLGFLTVFCLFYLLDKKIVFKIPKKS